MTYGYSLYYIRLQAQDAAERLYMVGTFYRYSADWGRVAAEEVLSERGASAKVRLRPGG